MCSKEFECKLPSSHLQTNRVLIKFRQKLPNSCQQSSSDVHFNPTRGMKKPLRRTINRANIDVEGNLSRRAFAKCYRHVKISLTRSLVSRNGYCTIYHRRRGGSKASNLFMIFHRERKFIAWMDSFRQKASSRAGFRVNGNGITRGIRGKCFHRLRHEPEISEWKIKNTWWSRGR